MVEDHDRLVDAAEIHDPEPTSELGFRSFAGRCRVRHRVDGTTRR
ncbi:MAG: hypothetical protein WAU27_03665 [Pseudomonadales bacterium]|jgi:hypothetical protein